MSQGAEIALEPIALEPIAISALQHWSYCPRQCALIHIEQQFDENVHTLRGRAVHARVDQPSVEVSKDRRIERAMPLWSERLGLIGKADAVEFSPDGNAYPIEYKHGPRRKRLHDELQLAAQALCLEEMLGIAVPLGAIYHATSKRRREVAIDAPLRAETLAAIIAVRVMLASEKLPPPFNDARCKQCSLIAACQPELADLRSRCQRAAQSLFDESLFDDAADNP
jgi:CRISPR-associated exonuclease Cas4